MSKRRAMLLSVLGVLCAFATGLLASTRDEVPMVRITDEVEISAAPAEVWKQMTSGASLIAWCPYWRSEANAKVKIEKVGDVLEFQDEWGNTGRTVITFIEKGKELRMAHEPADGSYVCHATLMLKAEGDKTKVSYVEQYTDESKPADANATAAKMGEQMKATLQALKRSVEKKS
jgi:uncharacterized protein YndB with AHSA1/START domain